MLTLYYKPTCLYSQDVLGEAERLKLHLRLKDVSTDPVAEEELLLIGGEHKVPFLTDDATGEKLYESNSIIDYLRRYNQRQGSALRVHHTDEVCESCQ
jgi:glutathione S-transferase